MTENNKRRTAIASVYVIGVTIMLCTVMAHATTPAAPAPQASAGAGAEAAAVAALRAELEQVQAQLQAQQQQQTAEGGAAYGYGGKSQADARNEGVEQAVEFQYPRQAPAVAQGSIAISGCGAGGNAGGSNTGGAAFLGFSFVTPECHGWTLAQTYAAIGDLKAACRVANSQKAAKRAEKRGATLPDCEAIVAPVVAAPAPVAPPAPAPAVVVVQTPDLSPYATKEALDRATRQALGK